MNIVQCISGPFMCYLNTTISVFYNFLYHFSQLPIVSFIQPSGSCYNIQALCHVHEWLVIKLPAVVSKNKSKSSKIHNPVLDVAQLAGALEYTDCFSAEG